MKVYHDQDADLDLLAGRPIAVIGYGNQGRSQALNLRDSGLDVIVGNREDQSATSARADGFTVYPIDEAAALASVVMLLIPDEVMPAVFDEAIAPHMTEGDALVFASGYNVAFGYLPPPPGVDVILVAPRMIGAGVRDRYVAGRGFPSFIGVAQDHSGDALALALALAKGIGSTRTGVVEVTFAQEAELDLFTEQCFGPAFGNVLTTAINLLLDEGYPPEAVLLELYMSGELSYTLEKIAELGMVEQSQLHSRTSQYGSMSRGIRFQTPELREKMAQGLEEIRSGAFAREWQEEQAEGAPTLEMLRESARSLPLYEMERELREVLNDIPVPSRARRVHRPPDETKLKKLGMIARARGVLRRLRGRVRRKPVSFPGAAPNASEMVDILQAFIDRASHDLDLQTFAEGRRMTTHYVLTDLEVEFTLAFRDGVVSGAMGPPSTPAEVRLETTADVLDGMFTGQINAARAAMSGQISFEGDARLAMSVQRIQKDLSRLYASARET